MAPEGFDEARWAAFLYARMRRREALEAGASDENGNALFREWFVGLDEGQTGSAAKVEVAALLGNLRLEGERGKRWSER